MRETQEQEKNALGFVAINVKFVILTLKKSMAN